MMQVDIIFISHNILGILSISLSLSIDLSTIVANKELDHCVWEIVFVRIQKLAVSQTT